MANLLEEIVKEDVFRVGVITSTHGIKGEVKVFPTTDEPERFDSIKNVILVTKTERLDLKINSVKYFKNMVIVKFKGINDINDIEKYKGAELYVTRENASPLEENEYYIADLLDCKVMTDEDEELGVLTDVLQTAANDVYVVDTTSSPVEKYSKAKEVLLPYIEECVKEVNLNDRIITVHVMDGLL